MESKKNKNILTWNWIRILLFISREKEQKANQTQPKKQN
jgi:hypothetical protein